MFRPIKKSIQSEFIFLMILGMLILGISLLLIMIKNMSNFSLDAAGREMNLACSEASYVAALDMHDIEDDVTIITNVARNDILAMNVEWGERAVESAKAHLSSVVERYAIKNSIGRDFRNVAENTDRAAAYYLYFNPEIAGTLDGFLYVKNENGDYKYASLQDVRGYDRDDFANVGWYWEAVRAGEITWLHPRKSQEIGKTVISCVSPIFYNGVLIAVIGMDLDFETLVEKTSEINIYPNGCATVADAKGRILHQPGQASRADNRIPEDLLEIFRTKGSTQGAEMIPYVRNGEARYAVYTTLQSQTYLIYTAPSAEIKGKERMAAIEMIILTSFLGMIFVGITSLYVRQITKPLEQISVAAEMIAQGNLDVDLNTNVENEVGVLAANLQITVNSLKKHIGNIEGKAYQDGLTHVKNIAAYEEMVSLLEEQMVSPSLQFAIVMCDLNELKRVNDDYGHEAGDTLIINSCSAICNIYLHSPVYRIGGDEFVVILQRHDYEMRNELLARMMEFTGARDYDVEEPWYTISIAIGMSEFRPGVDKTYLDVFRRADEEMYHMKRASKEQREKNKVGRGAS